jgi:hypothetical protein
MTGRCDKVEEGVNTVIAESRVTLDTRLLGQNIIVLALQVARDFPKTIFFSLGYGSSSTAQGGNAPSLVINLVTKAGSVDDGQGDACSLLVKLYSNVSMDASSKAPTKHVPTVTGLIRTPSST